MRPLPTPEPACNKEMRIVKETSLSRQKELEMKAIEEGRGEYRALIKRIKMGKPEMGLMTRLLKPFVKAIIKETKSCLKKSRGRPKKYCKQLQSLSPQKLALITIHEVLDRCADLDSTFTKIAMNIADIVEKELYIKRLYAKSRKKSILISKRYLKWLESYLRWVDPGDIRKVNLEFIEEYPNWDKETKAHLGAILIQLLIHSTKAFQSNLSRDFIKTVRRVEMSEKTLKYIQNKVHS